MNFGFGLRTEVNLCGWWDTSKRERERERERERMWGGGRINVRERTA